MQACVVFVKVGNAFLDFLKAGFGQLQRRVLVTPDVVLIFIKCTVEFPRIHLQNSSLELATLSRHELAEQCWVHHPGVCGSSGRG